ncbi:MAG: ATP phosphoribosyltransferase regulatory subunit [Eubacterium sp.]|nr:ATP phosphoribosyltransferase regulatory subunit [Eubacterium sp.]
MNHLIHTPEGVRDIFGRECDKKRYLERKIEKKFRSYGYQSVETPVFEFSEVFSGEIGTTPMKEMYRFFNRDGNMLVLRPDFTPSVARLVSMYFAEETGPLRLCYHGRIFQNNSSYQGRLKEETQMGVELYGDEGPEADAEMISLVVSVMRDAGLPDFQISLGHVDYFQSLANEACMDADTQKKLRHLLTIQNKFGVQELVSGLHLRDDLQKAFCSIPELYGDVSVLEKARSLTTNRTAREACDRLLRIYEILQAYGCENYVTFDLGMLTAYRYYSGIIFQAYTYGTGDAIIKGGRYNLVEHFGPKAAAVGFTTEVDALLMAIERQNIELPIADIKTMVLYPDYLETEAIRLAEDHRRRGMDVACVRFEAGKELDDYRAYGERNQFGGIIYFRSETERYAINLQTKEVQELPAD